MNRRGQALIEALVAGLLCFLSLWCILILSLKIIRTNQQAETDEEYAIATQKL